MKNYILLLIVPFLILIFAVLTYLSILVSLAITAFFIFLFYKKPIAGSKLVTIFLLLGILLRIAYLGATPFDVRGNDTKDHINYIEYIAKNHSLPKAQACWECFQQPLYYLAVSPVCRSGLCGKNEIVFLQFISLFAFAGFLYFGIKLLRLFLPEKLGDKYFNISSALLIFWPAGIIYSANITNDIFFYFFSAGCLYFVSKWFADGKQKDLWATFLFLLADMLTKNNAIILLAIVCFIILLKFFKTSKEKQEKPGPFVEEFFNGLKIPFVIFLILFCAFLKPISNYNGHIESLLVTNATGLNSALAVGNKTSNYGFDAKDFLTVPFTNPWNDIGGRQYFFNFLLKSSMFGEFNFSQTILKNQAIFMSYLLILLFIFTVAGILLIFADAKKLKMQPILLALPMILFFFLALVCYRFLYHYSCVSDFRSIFPAIIPLCGALGYFIYKMRSGMLGDFVELLLCVFILSSVLFYAFVVIV